MKKLARGLVVIGVGAVCSALSTYTWADGKNLPTGFSNTGSIANTRHNLSQSTLGLSGNQAMDSSRNDYGEVCVYCHTPHGAAGITAPLWNRTIKATTYKTYKDLGTSSLTQTVAQPGGSSLTCLSCHDGQTAIDSVINMPGSWRSRAQVAGGQVNQYAGANGQLSGAFLDSWTNPAGRVDTITHRGLNSSTQANPVVLIAPIPIIGFPGYSLPAGSIQGNGTGSDGIGCMTCHAASGLTSVSAGGQQGTDFSMFLIGTDLRNDHPVGVTFPTSNGTGTDWKTPSGVQGTARYFDTIGGVMGKMDKGDIRVYGSGNGGADGQASPTVECASCHDPHGVPDPTNGNKFKPTFLRVNNAGSAVCLTCHTK